MLAEHRRHVLITGGSRGLGASLAEHCVARGDVVTTCSRSAAASIGEGHRHCEIDVSDPAGVDALFDGIRSDVGYLDVLVNNAGIASMNAFALTPLDTIQRVMRTNVEATMLTTKAAIRLLRRSTAGRIVNVSTIAVPLRLRGEAAYVASKGAVEMFTRVVARELGPLQITCNAVGPSPIHTDLTASVPAAALDRLLEEQAIPRWATPADFINVIDFFLSPDSGMVTGQVVYLGGVS